MFRKQTSVLPGFGFTMGYTVVYLSLIVLIPIAALFLKATEMSWHDFWRLVTTDRALAAYKMTFGAALTAALINAFFGGITAWVLTRYSFPGRRFLDALVDFPFALPTAVAGLTLSNLFAQNGWLGHFLVPWGIRGAFTPLGVVIAPDVCWAPFRSAFLAARSGKPRGRDRRSCRHAGVKPSANDFHHYFAHPDSNRADRVRPFFCACHRRIRLGGVYLRKSALQNRDRPRADHDAAGGIQLCRGHGNCSRLDAALLCPIGIDQLAGTLD